VRAESGKEIQLFMKIVIVLVLFSSLYSSCLSHHKQLTVVIALYIEFTSFISVHPFIFRKHQHCDVTRRIKNKVNSENIQWCFMSIIIFPHEVTHTFANFNIQVIQLNHGKKINWIYNAKKLEKLLKLLHFCFQS
jgi:flagellar assembly factor FliW